MGGRGGEVLGSAVVVQLGYLGVDGQVPRKILIAVYEEAEAVAVDFHVFVYAVLAHKEFVFVWREAFGGAPVELESAFPVQVEMGPN